MRKIAFLRTFAVVFVALFYLQASAQTPRTLSFQGVLLDAAGEPKDPGEYTFTFKFYDDSTKDSVVWSGESKKLIVAQKGFFSTQLGDQKPFGASVHFDRPLWLSIQINDEDELLPRIPLTGAGYSFRSSLADTATFSLNGGGGGNSVWAVNNDDAYRLSGKVGVGTMNPSSKLHIRGEQGANLLALEGGDVELLQIVVEPTLGDRVIRLNNTSGEPFGGFEFFAPDLARNHSLMKIQNDGKVGIGTTSPIVQVHVVDTLNAVMRTSTVGPGAEVAGYQLENNGVGWTMGTGFPVYGANNGIGFRRHDGSGNEPVTHMALTGDGKLGLGTTSPSRNLHIRNSDYPSILVQSTGQFGVDASISLVREGDDGWHISSGANDYGGPGALGFRSFSGPTAMVIQSNGNIGIGTTNPDCKLDVRGITATNILQINGGADIAEPFEIAGTDSLPPGSVLVIDPENPGKLTQAEKPYDKRVAGIISGAGGVNSGLTLAQNGVLDGGRHVALSGRVYALATAVNGKIEPGDLLTTSAVPGHAMKATNLKKSQGAIIGKAMSGLEKGEGLVLVLASLQ